MNISNTNERPVQGVWYGKIKTRGTESQRPKYYGDTICYAGRLAQENDMKKTQTKSKPATTDTNTSISRGKNKFVDCIQFFPVSMHVCVVVGKEGN